MTTNDSITTDSHSISAQAPLPRFWRDSQHRTLLALTFPMILANITTPLIGLVDTAVLGHMSGSHYLAGASVAALLLTQMYWICGFIRMSTTGLSAQARGQASPEQSSKVLWQSLLVALLLGVAMLAGQHWIAQLALYIADPSEQVAQTFADYFFVRIWGAPAALANLALVGWLLGQQKAKSVMWIQIAGNLLNAVADVVLVYGFDWSVKGVALVSVLAEYLMALSCVLMVGKSTLNRLNLAWFRPNSMKSMTQINGAMLVRNLALQACLIFMNIQGIRLGQQVAATNAILMQFFVLIALGLDAIAYAVEAMVGEAKGAQSAQVLIRRVNLGLFWSSAFAVLYALVFALFGTHIIELLTDLTSLQQHAASFLLVIVLMPIVAHWCFLLDGVYVGLTRANAMALSMIVSALLVFFPVWLSLEALGNWALWWALLAFMAARGVSLGGYLIYLYRRRRIAL